MIVDLPIEEANGYIKEARKYDLDTVFFITPTTDFRRAEKIMKISQGFVYYISITGITGPKYISVKQVSTHIRELKRISNLPICVGFGIHNKEQARQLVKVSDGIIVGSAIVKYIASHWMSRDFLTKLLVYIRRFYV